MQKPLELSQVQQQNGHDGCPCVRPYTVLPDGVETVPKRFAIDYRNRWMIRRSHIVVTYVSDPIGSGAGKYKSFAERQGKTVREISTVPPGEK